jgi:hypothetical protein
MSTARERNNVEASKTDDNTIDTVRMWLEFRGLDTVWADYLPKNGYVVSDEHGPIAIGYIRMMEGNYGCLDSYITDPIAPSQLRDKALDLLTIKLVELAKSLEIKILLAFSQDTFTILRSERLGFKRLPNVLTRLDL